MTREVSKRSEDVRRFARKVRVERREETWLAGASISAIATASAWPALRNGFTYDDRSIILFDDRMHSLAHWTRLFAETYWPPNSGPALYRPIASLAFAIQWVAGHGAPWVFHAVSIALYAAVCVAVWALARQLLPRGPAWIAAALFAVHPVHVEAIAPAVGQSELWVALAALVAATLYIRWRGTPPGDLRPRQIATLAALYAVACVSKEQGIVVIALLAAAECTVVPDHRPVAERWRALRLPYLVLTLVAVATIAVREHVIGAFAGDYPHRVLAHLTMTGRLWTMLGVVPDWIRLLIWPARLVEEYAPPETAVYTRFTPALVPALVVLIGTVALAIVASRKSRVAAFGFAWLAISLFPVSNVLMPTGVLLAERTLFLPSIGLVLVIGAAALWVRDRMAQAHAVRPSVLAAAAGALIVVGAVRSATRERDWHDDLTLFAAGAAAAPRNAATHYLYGRSLFGAERWADGEREMRTALALDSTDIFAAIDLGTAYEQHGMCGPAEPLYRYTLRRLPRAPAARAGLARCLLRDADYAGARSEARIGMSHGYETAQFRQILAAADSGLLHARKAQ